MYILKIFSAITCKNWNLALLAAFSLMISGCSNDPSCDSSNTIDTVVKIFKDNPDNKFAEGVLDNFSAQISDLAETELKGIAEFKLKGNEFQKQIDAYFDNFKTLITDCPSLVNELKGWDKNNASEICEYLKKYSEKKILNSQAEPYSKLGYFSNPNFGYEKENPAISALYRKLQPAFTQAQKLEKQGAKLGEEMIELAEAKVKLIEDKMEDAITKGSYQLSNIVTKEKNASVKAVACSAKLTLTTKFGSGSTNVIYTVEKSSDGPLVKVLNH